MHNYMQVTQNQTLFLTLSRCTHEGGTGTRRRGLKLK